MSNATIHTMASSTSGECVYQVICPYCNGNHHVEKCPRVGEIEYYKNGKVKRVKMREYLVPICQPAWNIFPDWPHHPPYRVTTCSGGTISNAGRPRVG